MSAERVAALAGLVADRSRAAMCLALLDGRAWTAGELARAAGVSASTASEHLARLVSGGLLVERRQGRWRYLRLADPSVAGLLEALLAHAGPARPTGGLRASVASAALARARTCYDHLAGALGVAITDAMIASGLLDSGPGDGGPTPLTTPLTGAPVPPTGGHPTSPTTPPGALVLTAEGHAWLAGLGAVLPRDRPAARACLDWTERRDHLAGSAGAWLCAHLRERDWVRPVGSGRALQVTRTGESALFDLFGLDLGVIGTRPGDPRATSGAAGRGRR
ncbi:ArsR/SmtB family transcription factor [Actinosynnema mirum]|uniref:Putative transcriptional regulator, ArsR family n=1 Tax=Actinosynnema mirum (strain ATCC 29888 / DSM 43827 / JCM 3225 / NBRC 14064 / NCIMB 13271 / NRRL B-12336 / IMRU 3971 / 101) TaxID=446462 RepID=C6WHQ8_ACTMD|nr:helix-turn-helix domain-containing protein [Actinosynnema mirum]ACU40007.1 putative transcriptional regulator, ArsR family [Actinosynnema mirum DSM 43827]